MVLTKHYNFLFVKTATVVLRYADSDGMDYNVSSLIKSIL